MHQMQDKMIKVSIAFKFIYTHRHRHRPTYLDQQKYADQRQIGLRNQSRNQRLVNQKLRHLLR